MNDKHPAAKPVASPVVKKKVVAKKTTAAPKKSKAPPKPKPPPKKKQQPQVQKVSEKNLKYAAFKRPTTTQDESEEEEEEGPSAKTKKKATVVPEKKQKRVSEKSLKYAAFKKPALENNDTKAAKHNNDVFETSDIVGPDQNDSSDNEYEPTSPAPKKNKKATKKNTPKKVVAKSSKKKTPNELLTCEYCPDFWTSNLSRLNKHKRTKAHQKKMKVSTFIMKVILEIIDINLCF